MIMAKKNNKKDFSSFKKDKKSQNKAEVKGDIFVYNCALTVDELSQKINVPCNQIIAYFFKKGKLLQINSILDDEQIAEICFEHNLDFKKEEVKDLTDFNQLVRNNDEDKEFLVERCPVVTIMGHVDHGKTTLIDAIRNSNIASKEAGLITQSIGAYQKSCMGKKITFIDTPGHQAFKAMRARGASITDVIVLVVAADDGIMPQTKEAIHLARLANVPIIVAINKIDKEAANVEKVMGELSQNNLIPEEWGGDVIVKKISAKKNIGIDELLETILLVAEMKELRANPQRLAVGTVIEAKLDKKEGAKATLLVQNGTLHSGDNIVVGDNYCRIRRMTNEYDKVVKTASAGTPVVITGLSEVPLAGDHFIAYQSEKEAKDAAAILKQKSLEASKHDAEANLKIDANSDVANVFVIIKADNAGSAEALKEQLKEIKVRDVNLNIIRAQSGEVNENDVQLAINTDATIICFNTKVNPIALALAKQKEINIKEYSIIYNVMDDVKELMKKELKPIYKDVVYGHAEVIQLFKASKIGQIAGCMVVDGKIKRNSRCRIIRKNEVLQEDHIAGLKRFKDDVKEVVQGFDCGITLSNYQKLELGDIIECWGQEIDTSEQI